MLFCQFQPLTSKHVSGKIAKQDYIQSSHIRNSWWGFWGTGTKRQQPTLLSPVFQELTREREKQRVKQSWLAHSLVGHFVKTHTVLSTISLCCQGKFLNLVIEYPSELLLLKYKVDCRRGWLRESSNQEGKMCQTFKSRAMAEDFYELQWLV